MPVHCCHGSVPQLFLDVHAVIAALEMPASCMQGSEEPSLVALQDHAEHTRLRQHMQAFFSEQNVEAVYSNLCSNLKAQLGQLQQAPAASTGPQDSSRSVDMDDLAQQMIGDVVMKVQLSRWRCCSCTTAGE